MATVLDQTDLANDQDQENQKNQSQGQGQAPSTAAPTVGGPQGGGVATPGSAGGGSSSPAGTSSGSFNNIQKYLDANKDFNSQGGGLAGTMAGNINKQAQSTQQNIQGAQNAFQTQSQQAVNSFTNPDLVNQAFQDPNAFVQNQGNVDAFDKIRDATYTGPKSLQDLQGDQSLANLQVQTAGVNDDVNQAQSESGRFNLLKQMFGNSGYTAGQQNLDNLLIQSNPEQLKQIQATRQAATDTNRALNTTETAAEQQAAQDQQQAQQVQNDTRNRLNQSVLDENTQINNELTQAQQTQSTDASQFASDLASGLITQDDLNRFASQGLNLGTNLYNVDPSQFVTAAGNLTPQNVATADDYAKFAALNTLMGGANNSVANTDASAVLSQFSDPTQAGTYQNGPQYNFDVGSFLNAVQQAGQNYQSQAAPLQEAIGQANTALNVGDPNNYYQGGYLAELSRRAAQIQQQAATNQANYDALVKGGLTPDQASKALGNVPTTTALNGMSPLAILQNYGGWEGGANTLEGANNVVANTGSDAWLANQIQQEQQKLSQSQSAFNQLQTLMGANNTLELMGHPTGMGGPSPAPSSSSTTTTLPIKLRV